jgi:hypothetical protein
MPSAPAARIRAGHLGEPKLMSAWGQKPQGSRRERISRIVRPVPNPDILLCAKAPGCRWSPSALQWLDQRDVRDTPRTRAFCDFVVAEIKSLLALLHTTDHFM